MNRIIIIGAGGHGKVIADIALKNKYTEICFVDDKKKGECLGFPIIGVLDDLPALNDNKTDFVIAIGDNLIRKSVAEKYNLPWITLVHPSAQIASGIQMDEGIVVMAGAIINPGTVVKKHCIINSGAIIEHDNLIESYVHVSPNATLGGTVHVGSCTHIGLGAGIKNNIEICENCVIGVGAVVVNDLNKQGVYVGIPAKYFFGGHYRV